MPTWWNAISTYHHWVIKEIFCLKNTDTLAKDYIDLQDNSFLQIEYENSSNIMAEHGFRYCHVWAMYTVNIIRILTYYIIRQYGEPDAW